LLKVGDGLVESALGLKHRAQVVVGGGIARIEPDGFGEARPGRREVSAGVQPQAQVVVRPFVRGTQGDCLAEACHGVRGTTMGQMRLAQSVHENGIVGRK